MTSVLEPAPPPVGRVSFARSSRWAPFLAFQLGTAHLLLLQIVQLMRPADFLWSLNIGTTLQFIICFGGLGMLTLAYVRPSWLVFCTWFLPLPCLTLWMAWNACSDHSLSVWLVGIMGILTWVVWAFEAILLRYSSWLWLPFTVCNLTWLAWLDIDGYYYQFTGAHLSLYQIILLGGIDLGGIPELVGVSIEPIKILATYAGTFLGFACLLGYGMTRVSAPLPAGRKRLIGAALALALVSWFQFDFLIEARPIGDYLGWRIEMGLFPLPQPSRFDTPAMQQAQAPHRPISRDSGQSVPASYSWEPAAPKYNIVLLLVESWRADHFEPFMPKTTEVACQGLWLRNLQSQANGTVFSLDGIYSGKHPIDFFGIYRGLSGSPWLEFLKNSGYQLTRFSWDFERRDGLDRQFESRRFPGNDKAGNTKQMLDDVLKILGKPGPHMIEAYLYNTHFAYFFPPEFARFLPIIDEQLPDITIAPTDDLRQRLRNRYRNAIGYLDALLGDFFARVRSRHLDENTIFVVVGDHGESLGEDAGFGHCSGPHLSQYRIPGFILAPNLRPELISAVTQHLDLIPTMGHLCGFAASPLPGIDVREAPKHAREAVLQADASTANRLILRRDDRMSLFQLDVRGQLHWIITTRNDFTLDRSLLALYEKSGIASLAKIIESDRTLILHYLQTP